MYFNGLDWLYVDPAEVVDRDYRQERFTGDLRLDFRLNDRSTLTLNTGVAHMMRSIEMTGIGAAQAKDWTYSYAQARIRSGNLFAQGYINFSNAGDSYTLQDGQLVTDNSLLYVGQVQHGLEMGQRQRFTYGADLFVRRPWVVSATIDWGTLGEAELFRFRTTGGVVVHGVEVYTGYEYLDIDSTQMNGVMGGVRIWF